MVDLFKAVLAVFVLTFLIGSNCPTDLFKGEDYSNKEVIELVKKGITNEEAISLANALESKNKAKELDLSENDIDSKGATALINVLKKDAVLILVENKELRDSRGTDQEKKKKRNTLRKLADSQGVYLIFNKSYLDAYRKDSKKFKADENVRRGNRKERGYK